MTDKGKSPSPAHRRFKPYPSYKDSGVEWLGKIPEHWKTLALKRICRLGYGDSLAADERRDGDFEVYGSNGPVGVHDRSNSLGPCLVVGRKGSFGKINYSQNPVFAIDTTFFIDSRYSSVDLRWLYFALTWLRLDSISKDSAIPGLDREDAYACFVPVCSVEEQREVASFLDRETAKIDALIEKKERLIELLQEKRTALITQAVTKGLDPSVFMKDSGVEWIERIPGSWKVYPLFTVAREKEKRNIGNQVQNVLSLSYGKIINKDVDDNFGLLPESFETYQIVNEGNIILRLTDLQNDKRSLRVGLVRNQGIITSAYICLDFFRDIDPPYAFYLLYAYDITKVFYSLGGGVRQTMKFEDLKWLPILVPSAAQQHAIASYLDRETAKIDSLVAKIHEAIDRLKEYRNTLISAAVTGKIDVREA